VHVRFDFEKKDGYFSLHDDVYNGEVERSSGNRTFALRRHLIMLAAGKQVV
jgi:hypothetical protein